MDVKLLYFQSVRKCTSCAGETVALPDDATLDDLMRLISDRYPDLKTLAPSLLLAVNEEHSEHDRRLKGGDCVALMPPFSGG